MTTPSQLMAWKAKKDAVAGNAGVLPGLAGVNTAAVNASANTIQSGIGEDPMAGKLDADLAAAMQYLQPYLDVANPALQGLQGLSTPQGQAQALNQYKQSGLYGQQLDAAQEAAARAANATGYGRSGQAIIEQSQVPLALQQNYLNDQTARYGQLAGFGSQPSSQAFSGTVGQGQFGMQLNQNAQSLQAQADANKGNFWGDLLGIGLSFLPFGDEASEAVV